MDPDGVQEPGVGEKGMGCLSRKWTTEEEEQPGME